MRVDQQTLEDLEFDTIRSYLSNYCKSEKAKLNATKIKPFSNFKDAQNEFAVLNEIQQVYFRDDISFPHPSSQDIDHALTVLRVENGILTLEELIRVYNLCTGTQILIRFARKHREEFPFVHQACWHIESVDDVLAIIKSVLNKKMEIDDKATKELEVIRRQIRSFEKEIDKNFESALKRYRKDDVLDDSEETFIDNRRLLAVLSSQKKKVSGKVHGISAKGNLSYVEPINNVELNKRLDKLLLEERNEILNILQDITFQLRKEKKNLAAFERLLTRFDLFNAKVQLAQEYNGIIPKASDKKGFYWQKAYHPILLKKNRELNKETIPQDFELDTETRFLVISGPNAGGKSITLKTIGLVQVMYQSGLFVPVDDVSEFHWFDQLMSDIGDNQSIENQLSTYSYRLSRMQYFLNHLDENSIVLLDEFGSGSDPELGGALAEVFYEEMYDKNCFAVINTHYTNIKIITSKKEQAVNAFMLFDTEQLKPLYKLSVGQPGSSFTFEVARINGIEEGLIKRAQKKVSEHKVDLDQLAIDLQREKTEYSKANKIQNKAARKSNELIEKYESKLSDLYQKTNQQHQYFEQQNRFVRIGKKMMDLVRKHRKDETNKELNIAVKKLIAIEKKRFLELEKQNASKTVEAVKVEKPKPVRKQETEKPAPKRKPVKIGSRVKIPGYSKTGEVISINNETIEILIGNFVVKANVKEIEVFT